AAQRAEAARLTPALRARPLLFWEPHASGRRDRADSRRVATAGSGMVGVSPADSRPARPGGSGWARPALRQRRILPAGRRPDATPGAEQVARQLSDPLSRSR